MTDIEKEMLDNIKAMYIEDQGVYRYSAAAYACYEIHKQEMIRVLEELKYSVPFKVKDGDIYSEFNEGSDEGTKEFMKRIAYKILELKG